jgi:hypothetical protein
LGAPSSIWCWSCCFTWLQGKLERRLRQSDRR